MPCCTASPLAAPPPSHPLQGTTGPAHHPVVFLVLLLLPSPCNIPIPFDFLKLLLNERGASRHAFASRPSSSPSKSQFCFASRSSRGPPTSPHSRPTPTKNQINTNPQPTTRRTDAGGRQRPRARTTPRPCPHPAPRCEIGRSGAVPFPPSLTSGGRAWPGRG